MIDFILQLIHNFPIPISALIWAVTSACLSGLSIYLQIPQLSLLSNILSIGASLLMLVHETSILRANDRFRRYSFLALLTFSIINFTSDLAHYQ